MISRRSSCSDEPVRTEPSNFDQPSAIGGACKSDLSRGVSPLSPLLTRIASAIDPGRSLATYGIRGMVKYNAARRTSLSKAKIKMQQREEREKKSLFRPPLPMELSGPDESFRNRIGSPPPFPQKFYSFFFSNISFYLLQVNLAYCKIYNAALFLLLFFPPTSILPFIPLQK